MTTHAEIGESGKFRIYYLDKDDTEKLLVSFGVKEACAIKEHIDEIGKFAEGNMEE